MLDFEKCKNAYQSITPSEELESVTTKALLHGKNKRNRFLHKKLKGYRIALSTLAVYAVLLIGVKSNEVFANALYQVPVLGNIIRIITVDFYTEENEESLLDVKIPKLENTGYDTLEDRINNEIRLKINEMVAQSKQEAHEYREAYLETGGDPGEAWKMEIQIDYEITCSTDHYVSFVLSKTQSLASVYTEYYYYNIDLDTGKTITLKDLFGPSYKEQLDTQILEEMRRRFAKDNTTFFTLDDGTLDESIFTGIAENQPFYLKDDHTVVIVFEKYELAPGYRGQTLFDFPIPN